MSVPTEFLESPPTHGQTPRRLTPQDPSRDSPSCKRPYSYCVSSNYCSLIESTSRARIEDPPPHVPRSTRGASEYPASSGRMSTAVRKSTEAGAAQDRTL